MYTIKCLFALTGTIRGTSKEKLHQGLSLESFHLRRWYRKLCLFYKIFKNISPGYLFNLISARNAHYLLRTSGIMVSGKMPPGKKPPGKMPPRKLPPGNKPPKKIAPRKNAPQENCSPENCFPRFLLLLTLSYRSSFQTFDSR